MDDVNLVIQVTSAGYEAELPAMITINNSPVSLKKNSSGHFRGLHIVIVDSVTGKLKYGKVFDTYKTSQYFERFINQEKVAHGHIVIAVCEDECTKNLSKSGK